ncbi:MAG: hypothetical protein NTV70_17040 [Acidobacteria bacterium]|nr:hypothetical protein [Acidobacteriota bacterium]
MATPNNLLELAQARDTAAVARVSSARTAFSTAQAAVQAARTAHEAAVAQRAQLDTDVAQIRQALNDAETQADAAAAAADLGRKLVALRGQSPVLLATESSLAEANRALEAAEAESAAATVQATAAKADLAQATTASARRQGVDDALSRAPLSTLPATAKKLKDTAPTNKPFRDARTRIEADIPTKLIERARDRRAAALAAVANQTKLAQAAAEALNGLAAAPARAELQYLAAAEAVSSFIANAAARVDQAKAQLARVADPLEQPLSTAQKAAITATTAKGELAAAEQKKVTDAHKALDAAQADLAVAVLKAKVANLDQAAAIDANPAGDATLAPLVTTRDQALTAFNNAVAAYTPAMKADLAAWEASIPDGTWSLLADFEDASDTLGTLGAATPAQLITDRTAAEKAYVDALLAADKAARTRAFAAAERTRLEGARQSAVGEQPRRILSALRGDS